MSSPLAQRPAHRLNERQLVLLVAAIQFVNILDFVMVMPLGPTFARALGFPESSNGIIAGAYTAAAAIAGLVSASFLDRFDRRSAMLVALVGLSVGTLAGALAWDFHSLLATRVIAGMFGGPATSLAMAIIADVVPAERRGRAMGTVMGAFGAASVLGIPLGIVLGMHVGWRLPFLAVGAVGLVTVGLAAARLPSLRDHLEAARHRPPASFRALFSDHLVLSSYTMTFAVMLSGFIVIPNISAYVQSNLGLGATELLLIYLVGGACSFVLMPIAGRLVDRHGALLVGSVGSLLFILVVGVDFIISPAWPAVPLFVAFFIAMAPRNVAHSTLTSKVPAPELRARFMSVQSAVQHAASSLGGFISAAMLTTVPLLDAAARPMLRADGKPLTRLVGMPRVAWVAMGLALTLPLLMGLVERAVKQRSARAVMPPSPQPVREVA